EIRGYVGQYTSVIRHHNGDKEEISHGAIVVASGGREIPTQLYGYGAVNGVISQRELEAKLKDGITLPERVVMIQCVDSRDDDHPYCSRICCTQAIKNALEIKQRCPQTEVIILYRDIRTYGFRERLYQEARKNGVIFIQYDPQTPPKVTAGSKALHVEVLSMPEQEMLNFDSGLVVLSIGVEAQPENEVLSQLLKLPLTAEGFFLEAHAKLRPVDFAADGVFLCGLAHSPRAMDETIAQAQAASVRAVALLAKKELTATPIIASVNPRLCSACGLCVEVCPYGARRLEPGAAYAEVVAVLCQGCGACVAACPNKASQQLGFEFLQIADMIDAAIT
ncbi:MAG: CoB--CoM heterodisulfide reductase iron-sulfur subunit A family protein, partial [Anaerolineales bacterium]